MRRGDLFFRFFVLTMATLVIACAVLLAHFYAFQRWALVDEWRSDLEQEARWLGLHTDAERVSALANAWSITHSNTRLTAFDESWERLADSRGEAALDPELAAGLEAWRRGESPDGLVAVAAMRSGGWIAMSRPTPPGLLHALRWEMAVAVLAVVALVGVVTYPFARSMSSTLRRMRAIAGEVAAGEYGETLGLERSDELGDLARAFDEMSLELAEAERLRTRLLHDVSHELRSPLGRIRVLAETIAHKPERLEACLEGIASEVDLLDRIVRDLLAAAKTGSGLDADRRPTRLVAWAGANLARFAADAEAHGVDFRVELPEREIEVSVDRQRLTQAVANLVDNARRAVRGTDRPRIEVGLTIEDDRWRLSVADNGEGIAPADLEHVFRRFYRVGDHRDRDGGGVGLGLSVVQAIVRAHGGRASIESRPGEGTRVELTFPLADRATGGEVG